MRFLSLLPLLSLALAASPSSTPHVRVDGQTCTVSPIGGGQDDGPNIIYAFNACRSGGTIVLDQYYVVNTVLVITGLQDVSIELSGVGEFVPHNSRSASVHQRVSVQYTPNIAYWSPNSYYMEYQNAYVPAATDSRPGPHHISTTFWFLSGNNLHLYGGGTLDANGQVWWDYPNKVSTLPSHPDRPSHNSTDCGNRRWFFHHLCASHPTYRGQRLERSHRRSHPNWFSFLGTSHSLTVQLNSHPNHRTTLFINPPM